MDSGKIKVAHIITCLDTGGAEAMLYKLVANSDRSVFDEQVVTMMEPGPIGKKIKDLGIPVHTLGMPRGDVGLKYLVRLIRWLKENPPDIIQAWMYHANLLGSLAGLMAGRPPVVWNLRQSNLSKVHNKTSTVVVMKICALMSRFFPKKIVCGSHAALRHHLDYGYCKEKMFVVSNGFDLRQFTPDILAYRNLRKELNISEGSMIIGLIARFNSQKDHGNFIRAAGMVLHKYPDLHFVLCGLLVTWENKILKKWIDETRSPDSFHLLGERHDIPQIMAGFDVAVSSSLGEGFPNVVGEAMACGIPCVVSDVGDSALLVGDTGVVVPPADSAALAAGIVALIENHQKRKNFAEKARERVRLFSIENIAAEYKAMYQKILGVSV